MSPLVIVFVTVFIDLLGFGITFLLLPFYAPSFGASALTIGLLGTSFSLMQFVFSPVWGRWSDKIGRKPIILVGLLGSCLSYVTMALAGSLVLLSSRASRGLRANIPTAQPTSRSTTPGDRARGIGLWLAFGWGSFSVRRLAPASRISPETPMWCAAALFFANFAAAWFFCRIAHRYASPKSLGA